MCILQALSTNKIYQTIEPDGSNDELNVTKTIKYPNYQGSVYDYTVYYTDIGSNDASTATVVIAHNNETDTYYSAVRYAYETFSYNPNIYVEVTRTK